jgi:hypothetical protein
VLKSTVELSELSRPGSPGKIPLALIGVEVVLALNPCWKDEAEEVENKGIPISATRATKARMFLIDLIFVWR